MAWARAQQGVDSFDAEFEAPTASGREEEEDGVGREWALQSKHFFILSDAGKPIYSRYAYRPISID
jgi:hypothetical protein